MRSGIPDICIPCGRKGFHSLYIEMKVKGGKLSANQDYYIHQLQEEGNLALVAWSADEAIQMIEEYLS